MENTLAIILALVLVLGLVPLARHFLAPKNSAHRPSREVVKSEKTARTLSARTAVIRRMDLFAPLLDDCLRNKMNGKAWRTAILAAGNMELISYWQKVKGNPRSWRTILKMWGIEPLPHQTFIAEPALDDFYTDPTGELLKHGQTYTVTRPCWVLNEHTPSGATCTILRQGTAKPQ